jgi:pimeloyl-ACP methyl ester carboxylesterase
MNLRPFHGQIDWNGSAERRREVIELRSELILNANGVQLCAETFGERRDPAILLIMGSAASMDWWEEELCERIAREGRFVIRYDHRDTGRSVSYPPGEPSYTGGDLVEDALGLLDALGVKCAHLVGISMGGALAQILALGYPDRIASLALISTSFADRDRSDLPGMSDQTAARFAIERPDWSSRAEVIDYLMELQRASVSESVPMDEDAVRIVATRMFDRTTDIEAALTNHDLIDPADPPQRRLEELSIPTVVIHGLDDPLFPFEHGRALAETIPSAQLLALEDVGHELPRRAWDLVVSAILASSSASARAA